MPLRLVSELFNKLQAVYRLRLPQVTQDRLPNE